MNYLHSSLKRKAEQGGILNGSLHKQTINAGGANRFFDFDFTGNRMRNQCRKCGSDYMRFAVDGFCQTCIQKVEFIVREHPQFLAKAKNQNTGGFRNV